MIGDIPMPAGFRYKAIFDRGKPEHTMTDPFRIRHPSMDVRKRAKIFAPFDALKGFNEAVAAKDILYEPKRKLNEEEMAELNRRLNILWQLTYNGKFARRNPVKVRITYFVLCTDPNSEACGLLGRRRILTGICRKVDPYNGRSILIDNTYIPLRDIYQIEDEKSLLFTRHGPDAQDQMGDWAPADKNRFLTT